MAIWRTVQLAIAIAGTMAFIQASSIFVALPDLAWSDRWQLAFEILWSRVAGVTLQLLVLHLFALPDSAPRAQHVLRFSGMVLLGTVGEATPIMLLAEPLSIRLGIMESKATAVWYYLFLSPLMATFLVYQHGGQVRSEEASRRLRQLQEEQQAARRRLVEAQLQAMQAQVDPEMFFDVLDSVQRQYTTDASRAEALFEELIVFLRAALPRLRGASSTLAQELELVASHFRLQTLRGDTLASVHITLPDALAARSFPAGVLLPLLSGAQTAAIGVEEQRGHGRDDIKVTLRTGRAPSSRVLAQARETLAALYGSGATLDCPHGGIEMQFETRINIAFAYAAP